MSNSRNIANPIATPMATTTYIVTVTDANGCSGTDQVTVFVKDLECGEVYVPSAFSPNEDGNNDVLYVRGNCIKTIRFIIYDRWGEKVFESEDIKTGWDGKHKGKKLSIAAFTYYLKATLIDNSSTEKHGEINIIH